MKRLEIALLLTSLPIAFAPGLQPLAEAPTNKPCRWIHPAANRNLPDSRINHKVPRAAAFLGPIFVGRHSPQKSDPIGPFLWFFLLGPAKERTFHRKEIETKEASNPPKSKDNQGRNPPIRP
jgi:hypothetical protein